MAMTTVRPTILMMPGRHCFFTTLVCYGKLREFDWNKKKKKKTTANFKMPDFRKNTVYGSSSKNDEEFLLFYDANASKSFSWMYCQCSDFELDSLTGNQCRVKFRILKNDIYTFSETLVISQEVKCYNGFRVSGISALHFFKEGLQNHVYT